MPWQSQGDNGGGSGGGGSGGGGPWGGGGGGGSGGGPRPPDLEDMIRKGQDRFKRFMPSGSGGGRGIAIIGAVIVVLWLFSGFYRVQPDQQGVVLRFGEWKVTTESGLNWHWPYPFETVELPNVTAIRQINIGFRTSESRDRGTSGTKREIDDESLMLTGDQNIIDIAFAVQWKVSDPVQFLFNIREPAQTVKIVAESAMREIIGQTEIQPALTEARQEIEIDARNLLQNILTEYEAGIEITQVQLQDVQPPTQVIDAFDDVQRARQDLDRLRNQADAYRNDILPRSRGEAQKLIQGAEAYKERLINEADGEAQHFISVYTAYKQNPEVTKRRMYLETLQKVMETTDKVILDSGALGGSGAVPYLPLNELRGRSSGSGSSQ
jgi:membrane protease subunit HflK